jgi:hypothetical protein
MRRTRRALVGKSQLLQILDRFLIFLSVRVARTPANTGLDLERIEQLSFDLPHCVAKTSPLDQ